MHRRTLLGALVSGVIVLGTARAAEPKSSKSKSATPTRMVVHKSPQCGCCVLWIEHVREAGFEIEVRDVDDINAVKARLGVPADQHSCHTAEVGGYFVEGHVPAADVKRLLKDKPKAKGLALPGMPLGSPGMEAPVSMVRPYTVNLVDAAGKTVAYAQH